MSKTVKVVIGVILVGLAAYALYRAFEPSDDRPPIIVSEGSIHFIGQPDKSGTDESRGFFEFDSTGAHWTDNDNAKYPHKNAKTLTALVLNGKSDGTNATVCPTGDVTLKGSVTIDYTFENNVTGTLDLSLNGGHTKVKAKSGGGLIAANGRPFEILVDGAAPPNVAAINSVSFAFTDPATGKKADARCVPVNVLAPTITITISHHG